jgi:membrane associated rhomboid family serine protease
VFLLVFITLIELPALVVLGLWFLTQVVGATSGPEAAEAGVAWWAHVGGFVAGMLLMIMLKENRPPSSVPEPGTLESVFHRPARHDEPHWY